MNYRFSRKEKCHNNFPGKFQKQHHAVFFKVAVLKYFRKFRRKHPQCSVFNSKIRKNILPRTFPWKFSLIFQNNYFIEHFLAAVSLIRKFSWLNDSYLFLFFDTSVFSEYFSFWLGLPLNYLLLTQKKLLALTEKNISLFVGELLLREFSIQPINNSLEKRLREQSSNVSILMNILKERLINLTKLSVSSRSYHLANHVIPSVKLVMD